MSEFADQPGSRQRNLVRKIITGLVITTLALGAALAVVILILLSLLREYAKHDLAKAGAKTLTTGAMVYHLKFDTYPARLDQLVHPPEGGPYAVPGALLDPWGQPYQYDPAGPRNHGKQPDIWTITPKGEVIGNWP